MKLAAALTLCACWPAAAALAADSGASKGGAAYLDFTPGARAAGMGRAQAAVPADDVSALHANNALPALQSRHAATFTSGNIGLGRSIYFAGYSLPLRVRQERWCTKDLLEDGLSEVEREAALTASPQSSQRYDPACAEEGETAVGSRHWEETFVKTRSIDMAFSAGVTQFGIGSMTGRSEFGTPEADFSDSERAVYLAYAVRPYENLAIGIGGKHLTQKLQAASAKGSSFDAGIWYGVPRISRGELSFALSARDLGGALKWNVPEPELGTKFSYREPVLAKWLLGAAYRTRGGRWLFAADARRTAGQKTRLYAGLELRARSSFSLRAGTSNNNPTAGFSWTPGGRGMDLRFDYGYEYDQQSLYSPQWFTLTVGFLPRRAASESGPSKAAQPAP